MRPFQAKASSPDSCHYLKKGRKKGKERGRKAGRKIGRREDRKKIEQERRGGNEAGIGGRKQT